MKIIDEKGKIFGKINIIDFLVIFFLISFIPAFYIGHKQITMKPPEERKVIDLYIYGKLIKVKPEEANKINVGDEVVNNSGDVLAGILWIGKISPYQYIIDFGDESVISMEDSVLLELPVKLKLQVIIKDGKLFYRERQLVIKSTISFNTSKYSLEFLPLSLIVEARSVNEIDMEGVELYATFRGLTENLAKMIKPGDIEKDSYGKVIAEVLNVGSIESDSVLINLGKNNFIRCNDTTKKQVNAKLKINGILKNGEHLYFKDNLLTSDSILEFRTDKYLAKGKLSELQSTKKWIQLQVKFSGIIPELANLIREGDTDKDSLGSIRGKLKNIIDNKPSDSYVLAIRDTKYVTVTNPFQRDIVAILDVLCDEKDRTLYFKNFPIKIGNMIAFSADLYNISGVIIGVI